MSHDPREEQIFTDVLEQPPTQRAAFLEQACGADQHLRAAIEALLAAHDRAAAAIDQPAVPQMNLAPEESAGDRIGRYKLLERIGEGGYGVVYLAEQQEPVRRRVALKIIKLGMDTKAVMARFDAERQALAMMEHPNIAKVFDGDATASGRPYFVMELVHGQPITRFCDAHRLPTTERIRLFTQVCRALQHAHQKGIIHRDIKPSNILVTLHDAEPVPKVIDFGIAKATQGRLTEQTVFTAVEQFVGTPAYTSPEQANLGGLDVDTRSDIYSLGVLLYELLTGRTPFDAKELAQAGLDEIRRRIRDVEPPRPSMRLGTLDRDTLDATAHERQVTGPRLIGLVQGDLDWIVMRCLEKDRRRRYDTASDLALDLERHLRNEEVSARPPSRAYRLQKIVQRHKVGAAAAAVVALLTVAALAVVSWSLYHEKNARRRAVVAEQKAVAEGRKSDQVARFLQTMLQGVGPAVALGRDTTLLREIVDETAKRLETDLREQPEVEAELRHTIGRVYFELGEFERARAMHQSALDRRRAALGPEHPAIAQSLRSLGIVQNALGDAAGAEKLLREALAMQRKLLGDENLEVAETISSLATVLLTKRDAISAEEQQRAAIGIRQRLRMNQNDVVARSLSELALTLQDRGDLVAAEKMAREALAIQRKLRGGEHPDVAQALYALAVVLYSRGNAAEAELAVREAIAIQEKQLGKKHPVALQSGYLLAAVLYLKKDYPAAEKMIREVLGRQREVLGNEHPRVGDSLRLLALVLAWQQNRVEAIDISYQALEIEKKNFGAESLDVADTLDILAQLLHLTGDFARAKATAQSALAIHRRLKNPRLASGLAAMHTMLMFEGEWDEAIKVAKEKLELYEKQLGTDDRLTLNTFNDVALLFYRAGDYASALQWAEKAKTRLTKRFGADEYQVLNAREIIALAHLADGRCELAISELKELVADFYRVRDVGYETQAAVYYLGFAYSRIGDARAMEELFRRELKKTQMRYQIENPVQLGNLDGLGAALLLQNRFNEAEPFLRTAFEVLQRGKSGEFQFFKIEGELGAATLGQSRYREAEVLLLDSHKNLMRVEKVIPVPYRNRLTESAERLVALYTAWGKPAQAEEWEIRLAQLRAAEAARKPFKLSTP